MSRWVYLGDLSPKATIRNLETGELRDIMSAAIASPAPAGLRRMVLEELSGGRYRETGDTLPMSPEILDDLEDGYRSPNSWNYDWPHLQVEAEATDADRERIASVLQQSMAGHPYTFELTGLQRRFLMYYSDGNIDSQQYFERLVPQPQSSPYRRDGSLRAPYNWVWNSIMRDSSAPKPPEHKRYGGNARPCLYTGPAWVVRFLVDGQDPLLERCRVYVTDEGKFICSDWCQRHDHSTYGQGINLQMGIYSFDGWVVNACLPHAQRQGDFRPKEVTLTRQAVRDLRQTQHVAVTYDEALTRARSLLQRRDASASVTSAPRTTAQGEPTGPITVDTLQEGEAILQLQLARWRRPALVTFPVPTPSGGSTIAVSARVQYRGPSRVLAAVRRTLNTQEAVDRIHAGDMLAETASNIIACDGVESECYAYDLIHGKTAVIPSWFAPWPAESAFASPKKGTMLAVTLETLQQGAPQDMTPQGIAEQQAAAAVAA